MVGTIGHGCMRLNNSSRGADLCVLDSSALPVLLTTGVMVLSECVVPQFTAAAVSFF